MFILVTDSAGREVRRKNCKNIDKKTPLERAIIESLLAMVWMPIDFKKHKASLVLSQGDIVLLKRVAKKIYCYPYRIDDVVNLLYWIGKEYLEQAIPVIYKKDTKIFAESMTVHNGKNGERSRKYVAPVLSAKNAH